MSYGLAAYGEIPYGEGQADSAAATKDALGMPVLSVEFAFESDPLAEHPEWVQVVESDNVRQVRTRRGRSFELDQFDAGEAAYVLLNSDRRFDPDHTGSPYYPNVKPMKRTRVRATWNGATYPIYDGFVDDWGQPDSGTENFAETHVTATDGFQVLRLIDLPSPWFVTASSPSGSGPRDTAPRAWWRLGDAAGGDAVDTVAGVEAEAPGSTFPALGAAGLIASDDDTAVENDGTNNDFEVDNTFTVTSTPFTVACWVQFDDVNVDQLPVSAVNNGLTRGWGFELVGSNSLAAFTVLTADGSFAADSVQTITAGEPVFLVAQVTSEQVALYVNGQFTEVVPYTGTIEAHPLRFAGHSGAGAGGLDGTLDEVVVWDLLLTGPEIEKLYDAGKSTVSGAWGGDNPTIRLGRILDVAGWPDTARDMPGLGQTTNLQGTSGTDDALTHSQAVAQTELGLWFMSRDGKARFIDRAAIVAAPYDTPAWTLTDDGTDYVAVSYDYSAQPIRNDVRMQRRFGSTQVAEDSTSVGDFGRRVLSQSGLLTAGPDQDPVGGPGDQEMRDRAAHLLARFKDPVRRVTRLAINPRTDPDELFPLVLSLELGQRIQVDRTPQGEGSAVSQELTIEGIEHDIGPGHWVVTLSLSPAVDSTY